MAGVGGWQGMGGLGSCNPFNKSVYMRWGAFFIANAEGYANDSMVSMIQFPSAYEDLLRTLK